MSLNHHGHIVASNGFLSGANATRHLKEVYDDGGQPETTTSFNVATCGT